MDVFLLNPMCILSSKALKKDEYDQYVLTPMEVLKFYLLLSSLL